MAPKTNLILFLLFFASLSSSAQKGDVSALVRQTFQSQYPTAEHVEYKDNLVNVNMHFTLNGEKMVANYNRKGQWKETEKEWSVEQLPADVKDGFDKSKYADWTVQEAKIVYRPGGKELYRVKVEKNDLQKKYLFFNKNGRLTNEALTL